MSLKFANIPTVYNGTRFRSKLEARWAAMFDLIGWKWDYEPIELNGWIPDFHILNAKRRLLIEVKPTIEEPKDVEHKIESAVGLHQHKEWEEEAMPLAGNTIAVILGSSIFESEYYDHQIGWIYDEFGFWSEAIFADPCDNSPHLRFGLTSVTGCFADQIRGCGGPCCEWDGNHHYRPACLEDVEPLWRKAGNRVQWKAPR